MAKTVTVPVRELKNAEVRFVSLVARGANRAPFKIMKSSKESGMGIDLSSIGRIFKGESAKPASPTSEVLGFGVTPEFLDEKIEAIKGSGFEVLKSETMEDGTLFIQVSEGEISDGSLIRMSEDLVVVAKGFRPYDLPSDTPFAERVKAQGFYNGLNTACEALRDAVNTVLYSSKTAADAKAGVSDLTSQFAGYVNGLAESLPDRVFKADQLVSEAVEKGYKKKKMDEDMEEEAKSKKMNTAPEGVDQKDWDALGEEGQAKWLEQQKAKAKKDDGASEEGFGLGGSQEPVQKSDTSGSAEPDAVQMAQRVVEEQVAPVLKSVEGLTKVVQSLADQLAEVQKSVGAVATRVEKAEKAVGSTLTSIDPSNDRPPKSTTQKSESALIGLTGYDTAFQGRPTL